MTSANSAIYFKTESVDNFVNAPEKPGYDERDDLLCWSFPPKSDTGICLAKFYASIMDAGGVSI